MDSCCRKPGGEASSDCSVQPQANGLCEQFHRSMKTALRATLTDGNWLDRLPWRYVGTALGPEGRPAVFGDVTCFWSATACLGGGHHRCFSLLAHEGLSPCISGLGEGGFPQSPPITVCPGCMFQKSCALYSSAMMPTVLLFILLMMAPFRSSRWGPRLSWGGALGAGLPGPSEACSCVAL